MTETDKTLQEMRRKDEETYRIIRDQAARIMALEDENADLMRELEAQKPVATQRWIEDTLEEQRRLRRKVTELQAQLEAAKDDMMELLQSIQDLIDRERGKR